jgi:crotonobetainyl-CoA:carnitine CoA-transferase CaiB-like acyl-CoA transferase
VLGEHTRQILCELGIEQSEIAALEQSGVVAAT